MQNEASSSLGERLLNQELLSLGMSPAAVPSVAWEKLVRASGNKSIKDVFADIGLGKRLAAVAARRLVAQDETPVQVPSTAAALSIRGTEGMAIQLARCCQPIPGDPIIGSIRKGQGLVVHTHDCVSIRKSRAHEPQKWIDVEWEPEPGALFSVPIRVEVKNSRGVLAAVSSAIANGGSNIEAVAMDGAIERLFTSLLFTIQVSNRNHLAQIMRDLRHIPEVTRIIRERGSEAEA
jgi:GTP pyrophosphokinase/guanosine-3',5'-bis(diphosphate) 3'-pyrophosphohydrolase